MTANAWAHYFGFASPPFSKEIRDDDLWVPASRERRVDRLVEACHDHEHILLTGEPGVGKTCVLRSLRQRLPEAGFRLTYCHNATLGRRDFYRQLCLALGLSPRATAAAVFYEIGQHIHELGAARVHPVFLLDEAHLLHQDVLDHLHILANYDWDSKALLTIVLVGLPELADRLALRRNRSLLSRIHTRVQLGAASPEDTAEYIEYRVRAVGGDANPFSSDAVAILHEASSGRLRDIDRLATNALRHAASRKVRIVDRSVLGKVLGDHLNDLVA
ncbi:MAG: AAA family ATPase [Sandaracinaceae bacterium]|nr:AAA family ATPase [Sandaracinaceae bacterium]